MLSLPFVVAQGYASRGGLSPPRRMRRSGEQIGPGQGKAGGDPAVLEQPQALAEGGAGERGHDVGGGDGEAGRSAGPGILKRAGVDLARAEGGAQGEDAGGVTRTEAIAEFMGGHVALHAVAQAAEAGGVGAGEVEAVGGVGSAQRCKAAQPVGGEGGTLFDMHEDGEEMGTRPGQEADERA